MNSKIKEVLSCFNKEDKKTLLEEYNKVFKERKNKHSATVALFHKAYIMKTKNIKEEKEEIDEEVLDAGLCYNNYFIVLDKVDNSLFSSRIEEAVSDKKYGLLINQIINDNSINIKEYEYISIIRN